MRILATMLILQNTNLNIDGKNIVLFLAIQQFRFKWHNVPSQGFLQIKELDLLQILQMIPSPYRYFVRGV
jgi:hypothetical protein